MSDQMSQKSQVSGVTLQCCEDSDCQWGQTKGRTMSPIELLWTAKNEYKDQNPKSDQTESFIFNLILSNLNFLRGHALQMKVSNKSAHVIKEDARKNQIDPL